VSVGPAYAGGGGEPSGPFLPSASADLRMLERTIRTNCRLFPHPELTARMPLMGGIVPRGRGTGKGRSIAN
jgi:hypothetical protein